jgi:hypothetical protein
MAIRNIGGPRHLAHVGGPIDPQLQTRAFELVMNQVFNYWNSGGGNGYIANAPVETREEAWATASTLARGGAHIVDAYVATYENVMNQVYNYWNSGGGNGYIANAPHETKLEAQKKTLEGLGLSQWC